MIVMVVLAILVKEVMVAGVQAPLRNVANTVVSIVDASMPIHATIVVARLQNAPCVSSLLQDWSH
jgi:hypothetical protein